VEPPENASRVDHPAYAGNTPRLQLRWSRAEVVETGGIAGEMAIVEEDEPRSASVISSTY